MSQIDKRIKINTIIENQLPEFLLADFPNAVEFFKQYYISQEFQGGPSDLISNFDQYIKSDNLVPEVVVGSSSVSSAISSTDTTITVTSTKGFPSEYGLLKIDDEIISYTGITSTTFTGCIRGFSGISGYNVGISSSLLEINRENLVFEDTTASSHNSGSTITNLSVLFLQEFYKKLKKTFLPGLENNDFDSDLDVGNFVKFARSFYQSKGIEESVRILFKVLYGVETTILDLEGNLIKPSDAEYIRREVIVADLITPTGDPQNLVGQTIFKSTDTQTNASVSEVEILKRDQKTYYKISLFVGFSERDLIEGVFTVPGKTKVLTDTQIDSKVISVDSTVGFGATGTLISGQNKIDYTSKSINQFFGCSGVGVQIDTADDIRSVETIFGYENGDLSKRVDLRITGVLSELVPTSDIRLVNENENIFVKNVGEKIKNNGETYKQIFANSWKYNTSSRFQIDIDGLVYTLRTPIDKSSLKEGDTFNILRRNSQIIDGTGVVQTVNNNYQITAANVVGFTTDPNQLYDIRRVIETATSSGVEIEQGNNVIISDVLNVYTDGDADGYVASNSLPNYDITVDTLKETTSGISLDGKNPFTEEFSFIQFSPPPNKNISFIQGDAVIYSPKTNIIVGLESGRTYYVDPVTPPVGANISKVALYQSRSQIGTASTVQLGETKSIKIAVGVSTVVGVSTITLDNLDNVVVNDIIVGTGLPSNSTITSFDTNTGLVSFTGTTTSVIKIGSRITIKHATEDHTFIFKPHANRNLQSDKILRKIPLSQNLSVSSNDISPINDIGILRDGVQIRSPISDDKIYYGPLSSVEVLNGGKNYDIINPPKIEVESSSGTTALVEPVIQGSVKEVKVDPQSFDIEAVNSISITGGNGSGCVLQPVVGIRNRFVEFDSRDIFFNGGIDINDETITFKTEHNLENGQLVYYGSNENPPIGIGAAYDPTNTITGTLSDGDPYFVRVVNPTTVRIFNTKADAMFGIAGINTVGLSTDTGASGIHRFRTENRTTLISVRVLESGSGYTHRKLRVSPSGISTSYNTITFSNHGFKHGDLINYSPTVGLGTTVPKSIQGLSTSNSYYVVKIDDDSFKLADAGVGGTSITNFNRGKIVGLGSTGTGYQTFQYPEIKVNVEVSYGSTVTGTFAFTPLVTGEIIDAYVYEKGTDYGSTILNHQIKPEIKILNGKNGEIKPVIVNGRVEDVAVVNRGSEYFSTPDLEVKDAGSGSGAIVRPVIEDGKIIDAIVINSGIGYNSLTSEINVIPRGTNGVLGARVRTLGSNRVDRFGDFNLTSRENSLSFSVLGYSQDVASSLEDSFSIKNNGEFNQITSHSPIIGWAYDGNPIYGPFGYSDPDNINSDLKLIKPSYKLAHSNLHNRPSGFKEGFFLDDYIFDGSGDLDIHNGRFGKTPEFPNGIYAYFATVGISSATSKLEGVYPYFIGKSYRSPLIEDNITLDQNFDFNNSNLLRNTLPYVVDEKFADNDFIIESNETIRQISKIESVTKGDIDNITVLDGGIGYKVGDLTVFDNTETGGSGFSAKVDEIVGIGVSRIDTTLERFENLVFEWKDNDNVEANYLPFVEMNNGDSISVSGLSSSIINLTGSFNIGIKTDTVGLAKTMTISPSIGKIEDLFVSDIPNTVSIGSSLRIGNEIVKVLNLYDTRKIIRVRRFGSGIGHTLGSNVDILNSKINIPVKTTKFDSKVNDIVYFNGIQSVGVGTTSGGATSVEYVVGETKENLSIPTRTIHLPNHPFKTGQKVTLSMNNGATKFDVGKSPNGADHTLPFPGVDQTDVFIVNKGDNFVGVLTSKVGIGSTSEGMYFYTNGSNSGISSGLYFFSSQNVQVTGDIDKVTTLVTTNVSAAETTTHNLQEGDIIKMKVVPNLSVGIGTTTPISVNYNSQFDKLLLNPISFAAADVETNRIDINNHGFKTGDKVFYNGSATGLSTGSYFINKVSDRYFQLTETLSDLNLIPANIVPITANTGGANQTLSLINPRIDVVKNSKLTFGLSSTTLSDFDFKIFYDKDLTNEFLSSKDTSNFNVIGVGTIGIGTNNSDPIGAAVTITYSEGVPDRLYYGLSKGGFISTSDTDVKNYAEIRFVDSVYNGEYRISGVTSETFNISPLVPEFLTYLNTDCDNLEYSTRSANVTGAIKDFKIISKGFNYKKLPTFKSVTSANGKNANIIGISTSIGRIKDVRIVDIGYEYSSDKTLSPEAFISPIVNIDNLDVINDVTVIDGGSDYINAPNLLVYNPISDTVVDNSSLNPLTPNQTISEVKVTAPVNGLDSITHTIVAVNNSNGIGINSVQTSVSGIITCFLETPMNGFVDPQPFAKNDKIFVEGIQRVGEVGVGATQGGISTSTTVIGDGFNSENYNYRFFNVDDYIAGTQAIVKFSVAGLTTNPGVAKTFQSGYASIINKNKYPIIEPIQTRGTFELNESLLVNSLKTDLLVVEIRDDYIKIDGKFEVKKGDRISGRASNVSAEITSLVNNKAKFKTDFSNRQEYGWIDDIGKLNEDYQVISDNDYYQNLSYTVKSTIEWDKFVNPVNRLVHPAGLKNFADTSIESQVKVGIGTTALTNDLIVLDVLNVLGLEEQQRVDAINNFDFVRDYDTRQRSSKFVELSNKVLSDFTRCKTNRVLVHDDISGNFSSTGFQENNTTIEELTEDFGNYLIQIIDPDTSDVQFTEIITLTTTNNAYLLEKTTDFTTLELGEFSTEITSGGTKNLVFTPTELFTKDHDIKILKIDFNTDLSGIGTHTVGQVDLIGSNVGVDSASSGVTTTTIAQFSNTDFNGLYANVFVQDSLTKEINYNEIIVDFDGTDTTTAQTYIDTSLSASNSSVGIITSRFENNLIKLQIENDRSNSLEVRSNVVGLGTTTTGIGTHRFLSIGQPEGTERSARLESNYVTGTASTITYATLNKNIDSSVKSLVRISCGETSAIHQIISLRDADDVLTVQYPFVSAGSTTGIGTFGGEISGNNINLRFYPDSEFDSLIEVQSYSQIFNTLNDFANVPLDLTHGTVTEKLFLSSYDGLSGLRANKVEFDLKHKGVPIYQKTFNPVGINSVADGVGLVKTTGLFNIPNHFFNTNEELTYTPSSSFTGIAATAVSIGATANLAGVVTTILPSTVYAKVIDENKFQIFTRPEYVASGSAVTFTGIGSGNNHKLTMTKQLTKTIIGLDGVVQQPVTFTKIAHTLGIFDGFTHNSTIGVGLTQFILSGIGSITTSDILKVNDEYMIVTEVGFSSTPTGTINDAIDVSSGIATLPSVKVRRGQLGLPATTHSAGATARLHRGSFNIVDSSVYFTDPPKGNTRSRKDDTNLPFVKADFSGRTFLRSNYTTNMLFDDISDDFTGIGKTYSLTVGGANTTSGVGVGNGILFINGVFQTPLTLNNTGNNYEFITDATAGISTVQFTGITSENGDNIISESDINQNQVPRGGIILSLGSTQGLGYAPLLGAKVKAEKNAAGGLTGIVGIGTSSGFNLGIQTASYDNITGIITVTTDIVHGFGLNRPNTVKLKDLNFNVGSGTTIFTNHDRPLYLVGIVSDRTFEVRAGVHTQTHTYTGGGNAFEFFEDLNFGSGYRGGSVAIGVTDQAYEHRFVSSGIGSIRKGSFAATGSNAFTATNAVYTSHSGTLLLTIPNHGLTTSDAVGIDTGGLVFKCSKDDFFSDHPYPRAVSKTSFPNSDPIAGIITGIGATTLNTITLFVGKGGGGGTGAEVSAIVGAGGTLAFTIDNAGTGYVNPEIIIPEPNYDNVPVVGVSRLGVGATTDTGSNLLLDLTVGAANTTVGIGSTLFEISNFQVARQGHSFKIGDKFKPVGLVTASHLSSPIQEFELEVLQIFNDKFSAWQFGEIDFIDDIKNLQDGSRLRFPLFFNGQLLSFEKDASNAQSALIDLDAVLLIFVNGVLQKPGVSYQFEGGTTFTFVEPPSGESSPGINDHDKVDIFFYKGQDGVDVDIVDVQESIKIGDQIKVTKSPIGLTTSQTNERVVKEILGADLLETNIYTGLGVDETNEKPIRWTKQKVDLIINGEVVDKSRPSIEPQIYPTAKIIGDLSVTTGEDGSGSIFVDEIESFVYEDDNYGLAAFDVDALITSGEINVGASATAIVSAAGTISNINITNAGSGYLTSPNLTITPPIGAGTTLGIGSTAFATATISNGAVNGVTLSAVGFGYTHSNPPQVLIEAPEFQTEKITSFTNTQGFTGIITGIAATTNGSQPAIKFFYRATKVASDLAIGYPVMIKDTSVGNGVTSVDTHNSSVVGIGTTFLDNIYIVHGRSSNGEDGEIVCNVMTGSNLVGIATTGFHYPGGIGTSTSMGRLSWGRIFNGNRSSNPISIGVTGLTVDAGLSTFPTIQRKNYVSTSHRGLRSTGAIRVFGL